MAATYKLKNIMPQITLYNQINTRTKNLIDRLYYEEKMPLAQIAKKTNATVYLVKRIVKPYTHLEAMKKKKLNNPSSNYYTTAKATLYKQRHRAKKRAIKQALILRELNPIN